jgi:hypothetical protein
MAMVLMLSSCGGGEGQIVGKWKQQGEHANNFLDFRGGGDGFWIFHRGENRDTFPMKYLLDLKSTPNKLDLTGYGEGPFQDMSYYGIIEFQPDGSLKVQMNPGAIGQNGDTLRPKVLDPKAIVYKKEK